MLTGSKGEKERRRRKPAAVLGLLSGRNSSPFRLRLAERRTRGGALSLNSDGVSATTTDQWRVAVDCPTGDAGGPGGLHMVALQPSAARAATESYSRLGRPDPGVMDVTNLNNLQLDGRRPSAACG